MISKSLIILAVVGYACAATWMGHLPMKPQRHAHKEGCFIDEIDDVVPFGAEVKPIGHCYRINCSSRMLYYASCGTVGTDDPSCYVTKEDTTRPYPACCPTIKCEADNRV